MARDWFLSELHSVCVGGGGGGGKTLVASFLGFSLLTCNKIIKVRSYIHTSECETFGGEPELLTWHGLLSNCSCIILIGVLAGHNIPPRCAYKLALSQTLSQSIDYMALTYAQSNLRLPSNGMHVGSIGYSVRPTYVAILCTVADIE